MFCGFYISLLGKPDSPLPEITEDSEPLVNAIYAWQHTFIADFPLRYDHGEIWQVAEATVKPGQQLLPFRKTAARKYLRIVTGHLFRGGIPSVFLGSWRR
ncbi:hypothetical protein HMPREF1862_01270 [Varibaculum cambriense]|uniref:Uncharacterized protein n=1 Tax=Varibaculum cambriense TaxID=184870 RepID=A0AB34WZB0_9ACTO|nr:hypothetical protein [Varibaculum cambriense]KXB80587.1 hypothetical protein HMPREF1862_01270 [Varibaculum cambriense]